MMMTQVQACRKNQARLRMGTTAVEFSIVLPLFLLIIIGGLQLFRFSMTANTVEMAVMASARRGILARSTEGQVESAAVEVLDSAGLVGYSVDVNKIDHGGGMHDISIQIQLPLAANGFLVPSVGNSWNIQRGCTLRCE